MLIEEWMHRKAEENAHNEILAFLTTILGINLLVGGLIVTILVAEEPNWLLILPYVFSQKPPAYIGLTLTITGFLILLAGFILVIHYDRKRRWYIKEIEKSSLPEKMARDYKTVNQILEEYVRKRKSKTE